MTYTVRGCFLAVYLVGYPMEELTYPLGICRGGMVHHLVLPRYIQRERHSHWTNLGMTYDLFRGASHNVLCMSMGIPRYIPLAIP